jgi:PAS domain S-box-containing protein
MASVNRHLLLVVLSALLPLLLVAALLAFWLIDAERKNTEYRLEETAHLLAQAVDSELQRSVAALQGLSRSEALRRKDLKTFYAEAADVREVLGLWDNLRLLSPFGEPLLNLRRPFGEKLPPTVDPEGVRQAVATRTPYISDLLSGGVEAEPRVYVAYPVIEGGDVKYVIAASTNYRYWSNWLRERTPPGTIAAIIDRNFSFVARSQDAERLIGTKVQPWYAEVLASQPTGVVRGEGVLAADVVVAFTRTKVAGWYVNVLTSGTVLDAPIRRTAWTVSFAVAIALAIAIVLALRRAGVLTRGIRALQDALDELKVSRRLPVLRSSIDEIQTAMDAAQATAEVLADRAERLNRAQEAAQLGLWDMDLQTNTVRWSEGIFRLLGAEPNAIDPSTQWFSFLLPEDKDRVLRDFDQIAARGGRFSEEFRVRRTDGSVVWLASIGTVDHDSNGVPIRMQGVNIDITARKEAEALLRQSEAKFRTISHAAPAMVWVSDAAGGALFFNQRWFDYTGQTMEEAKGIGWVQALHPEDAERLRPQWQRCLATGDIYEGECRYRSKKGDYRWFAFRAMPTRENQGAITQWFGCSVDIHDARQAQELLKEADRRKDEFLATLAHELRNPLAPIRNALQIVQRRNPTDPIVRSAQEMMDRQVSHMVRLIDDLLDVSRITRGKLELRREPIELAKVLEQALETSRPHLVQELSIELPQEPVYLDADPIRLSQVFSNLFNNAAKFTPRSGKVSVRAEMAPNQVVVRVRDTGEGIPAEQLPRLFEIFSQGTPGRDRAKGGLGIGLSLAQSLVELHGGTISAHSEGPGKGSEFVVRLPALVPLDAVEFDTKLPVIRPNVTSRRVLVVDDVADSVQSLADVLRIDGHVVETAADGVEAVEKANSFAPHLILLDLGLPKLDGFEVCEHIRRQSWGADIVIVALTGWGHEEDRRRTLAAGFDAHLVKPVEYADLIAVMAREAAGEWWLKRKQATD